MKTFKKLNREEMKEVKGGDYPHGCNVVVTCKTNADCAAVFACPICVPGSEGGTCNS